MASLSNLMQEADVTTDESDSLGGVYVVDSGTYPVVIDIAYIDKSQGGATSLNLHFKGQSNEFIKQTLWIVSGNAKGNKTYYVDKKGGKQSLPGFNQANAICKLTLGKEIGSLDTETKVINLYNFEAKKEIPTKVEMLTDLIGQELVIGLIKQVVDKNVKNDTGQYVPSGETREENELDKVFNKEGLTITELRAGESEATFISKWSDKWKGQVKNKAKGATAGGSGGATPGMPKPAAKPTESLFI